MERKYININELKNVLSSKELKNVKGGSGGNCSGGGYCTGNGASDGAYCESNDWCYTFGGGICYCD